MSEQRRQEKQIEVTVPGHWLARPADQPLTPWAPVTATPATVEIREGEVYRLRVGYDATGEQMRGLAGLNGVTSLEALDMGSCYGVTDESLASLRGLTQLKSLDIQWCEAVTDAGLAHLAGLTGLQELNLTWVTAMTDAGLASLHGLTQLRSLALDCCWNVTAEAVEAFRARVPACYIEGP